MIRLIFRLYYGLFIFFILATQGKATQCIGYFDNAFTIGASSQWGNQGDQFASVNMTGILSWPSGRGTSMYKAPHTGVPQGNWSTYSIALPKEVVVNGFPLTISVPGRTPFRTPLNPDYNAWLVNTVTEGCRALQSGWNAVSDAQISAGTIHILLQGQGLPSGIYNIQIPYTLAWGTDPNQSEAERVQGTWAEINPVNKTGMFDLSFEVKNKCDIPGENDINFDYGTLSADNVNGSKKETHRQMTCLTASDVSLSLSPAIVDLKNGVVAMIKIKDATGAETNKLKIGGNNIPVQFSVESELQSKGQIKAGEFSGSSILSFDYD
ncbi:hypothetical protein KSU16_24640 [Escherichia coli]|uniref:MrpH family fimbial adhesin n=1 Tax=Escherichia coli TaxID=562 RepID=UPI0021D3A8EE|nr:hypothetical protein [Escherichia coli]MCU6345184.1 hypothetical protein [Escherichia coli]